jgi:hypothetical protein
VPNRPDIFVVPTAMMAWVLPTTLAEYQGLTVRVTFAAVRGMVLSASSACRTPGGRSSASWIIFHIPQVVLSPYIS